MKVFAKGASILAISFFLSFNAFAGDGGWDGGGDKGWKDGGGGSVPEMDAGMAVLALGLVGGIATLVAERRKKK